MAEEDVDTVIYDGLPWKNISVMKTYHIMRNGDYLIRIVISMTVGEVMTTLMHWVRNNHIEIACGALKKHLKATFVHFVPILAAKEHRDNDECETNVETEAVKKVFFPIFITQN